MVGFMWAGVVCGLVGRWAVASVGRWACVQVGCGQVGWWADGGELALHVHMHAGSGCASGQERGGREAAEERAGEASVYCCLRVQ